MITQRSIRFGAALLFSALVGSLVIAGCGEKKTPTGKELLKNGSFEEVSNGLPVGWEVRPFRGFDTGIPSEWGIDEKQAYDGKRSFYFQALPETRRFFVLSQSVEVKGARRLRLRGALRTLDLQRGEGQFPQSNFALTFYDKDGNRFDSQRFYDLRTQAHLGTSLEWIVENRTFRIPDRTARVDVQCALGMQGKMWFDAVSLDVPPELPWLSSTSKNFTFHWLAEKPYPEGSREFQQALFDNYCTRLGIAEGDRPKINMYFYPDSAALYAAVGEKTLKKSYWDEAEVHSVFPVDDHEIIHIITKPYGVLPFALTEGTAFYLIGELRGQPVLKVAQELLREGRLPGLVPMLEQGAMVRIDPNWVAASAASFVGYLIEMYGPNKFLDLHRAANASSNSQEFDKGFQKVYGFTAAQAEAEWQALLRKLDFSGTAAADSTAADTTGARRR
jgi:hypothetical protein